MDLNEAFLTGFSAALEGTEKTADFEDALLAGFIDEMEKSAGRFTAQRRMANVIAGAEKMRAAHGKPMQDQSKVEGLLTRARVRGRAEEGRGMTQAMGDTEHRRALLAKSKGEATGRIVGGRMAGLKERLQGAAKGAPPSSTAQTGLERIRAWKAQQAGKAAGPAATAAGGQALKPGQFGRYTSQPTLMEHKGGPLTEKIKKVMPGPWERQPAWRKAQVRAGAGAAAPGGAKAATPKATGTPSAAGPAPSSGGGLFGGLGDLIEKHFPGAIGKGKAALKGLMEPEKEASEIIEKIAAKKWIQKAIKKPGALSKQLGVPEKENIPASTLAAAAKSPGKLGKRARLAQTLKKLRK